MRIISGTLKGRKINTPKNLPVRPTTNMAKEALFNILNNSYYFKDISVLDLFAGTGNISLEFASRGCKLITSVDSNYKCIQFINNTANLFSVPIHTIKSNVYKYLENCQQQFDIIFADPPYNFTTEEFTTIANLVFNNNLLNKDGLLIIEHSKQTNLEMYKHFKYLKSYGGCVFSFFEN